MLVQVIFLSKLAFSTILYLSDSIFTWTNWKLLCEEHASVPIISLYVGGDNQNLMHKIINNHTGSYKTFYDLTCYHNVLWYFVGPKTWGHIVGKKKKKICMNVLACTFYRSILKNRHILFQIILNPWLQIN